jgi:Thioredoxin reductase
VHRRSELRAEKILQERLFKNNKINIIWDHVLKEVKGSDSPLIVNQAVLESIKNKKLMKIDVSGIFVAIGHDP